MTIYKESKIIFFLAIPLIIGQIGQMLLGIADSVMIARCGITDLAALTLANNLFHLPLVFGIGVLTCISVRTATARGAGDAQDARNVCRNGISLALLLGSLFFLIAWLGRDMLHHLGQEPNVVERSKNYFLIVMASLIPGMVGIAQKNHADALNRIWFSFWISAGGVILNISLNWILIYGNLGAPALGLEGAGIATLIARIAIVIAMFIWFSHDPALKDWTPHRWWHGADWLEFKSLIKLGLPAGILSCTEIGAFVITALIVGTFGATALAAHNIAMAYTGLAFMIPLGLSIALTIRVGEKVGNKSTHNLRTTYLAGWGITLIFSIITAAIFLLFNHQLAAAYVSKPDVISLASTFLIISGLFQIVDGQQIVTSGMLRGLKDTKTPALYGFLSYWVIGIPFGYWLAYPLGIGPAGNWWGLLLGLSFAATLLGLRLWKMEPQK